MKPKRGLQHFNSDIVNCNLKELQYHLSLSIMEQRDICIWGNPSIDKPSIVKDFLKYSTIKFIEINCPDFDKKRFEEEVNALNNEAGNNETVVILLHEITKTNESLSDFFENLISKRIIENQLLAKNWFFIITNSNLLTDNVSTSISILQSSVIHINYVPDDCWIEEQ